MTFEKPEDKRRFHRILYKADATLTGGSEPVACKILDLSLQGCLLLFEQSWSENPESLYTLTFRLSATIAITMAVSVSHVIGNEVGFKCEHIDIDSLSQLRRLVELNLGDSSLLERDLLALSEPTDY